MKPTREESFVNRIKLLFALGASVAVLANQACSNSAQPGERSRAPEENAQALTSIPTLRIDAYPAVLPGAQFAVDVSFRDATGNLLNVAKPVTIALGKSIAGSTLTGTKTITPASGVAHFGDLALDKVGQGYTLVATSSGASAGTSSTINVTWSENDQFTAGTGQNTSPAAAQPLSPAVPVVGSLADDVRYYRFHAATGQLLSVMSWANRMDPSNWDTSLRLRLLAANGTTEITRSGAPNRNSSGIDNGILALRIPADGDYFLGCDSDPGGFQSGQFAIMMTLTNLGTVQTETEPWGATGQNDSPTKAQALSPGLLFGHFDTPASNASTSDFYKIAVTTPSRVRVDLVAARNGAAYGDSLWDARLELQDASGTVLWANDDAYSTDPVIDYVITKAGTYYVRVARSENRSNTASSPYMLSYASTPYLPMVETARNGSPTTATPIAYGAEVSGTFTAAGDHFFAFGGAAGDVVRLVAEGRDNLQPATLNLNPNAGADAVLLGTDGVTALSAGAGTGTGNENKFNIRQTILQANGTYFVRVRSQNTGKFGLRLELFAASAREVKPNNTPATATRIDTGWVSGNLATAGDVDHFKVHAEAGQFVSASLLAAPGYGTGTPSADWGSALMANLEVHDAQGNLLAATSADRLGNSNFAETDQRAEEMVEVAFRAPAAGDYDLAVSDADGQGGAAFFYALQLRKNQ